MLPIFSKHKRNIQLNIAYFYQLKYSHSFFLVAYSARKIGHTKGRAEVGALSYLINNIMLRANHLLASEQAIILYMMLSFTRLRIRIAELKRTKKMFP